MIALNQISDEVYVAKDAIVALGEEECTFLKQQAQLSPLRRARICLHRNNDDSLHEMLIAISSQGYIQPHKHMGKSESFHVVEGIADVVVFDDQGNVINVIELGAIGSGLKSLYRLSEDRFHTLIVYSDILVIHEVTNGPFNKEQTVMASFAPSDCIESDTQNYMQNLSGEVARFKGAE